MLLPAARPDRLPLLSTSGRWLLAVCVLGSSLTALDGTLVRMALPAIGDDLNTGFATLQWVMSAYAWTLASLILLGGAAGDQFGQRRIFIIGVAWFACASVLCAAAPNTAMLLAGRVVEGAGAALATPTALAVVESGFRAEDRARAIGAWAGLSGIAAVVAPLLGGWLLDVATWRLVFLIAPLLSAPIILLTLRHMPSTDAQRVHRRLDLTGAGLCLVGLGAVTFATITAAGRSPASGWVLGPSLIAGAALVAFWRRERRSADAMLPGALFRSRQFAVTNVVTFALYGSISAYLFLVVIELQVVEGLSALLAGSALVPITVLVLLLSGKAARLTARSGPRLPLTLGPLVCAAGVLLALRLGPGADYLTSVLPTLGVFGIGLGVMVAPLTAAVLGSVDDMHAGLASGVNNAVARTAGLLSIAALPVLVGLTGQKYTDPHLFLTAFHNALILCAAALSLGGLLALALLRGPASAVHQGGPPGHCDAAW